MENKEQILSESIKSLELNNYEVGVVQDNKLVFIVDDKNYRVRMPIQSEQALIDHKRNLTQLDYLNQEGCITRKQLAIKLKESGVLDIEKIEARKEELTKELKQMWFALATKSSSEKNRIEEYKEKINKIQDELKNIAVEVGTQLAPSLESRLEKFIVEYTTFLCTDVQSEGKWIRVWETIEDFNKTDSPLTERAAASITWLLLNKRS
jgi:uncharacterized membrane-anchored protein YjiN (DUF445 family)